MSWAEPWLLWVLAAVPFAAVLMWWLRGRLRRRQASVGAGQDHLTGSVSRPLVRLRAILLWSGLAVAILAAAGPRWGAENSLRKRSGADILVVLDCSRSMQADDLSPTRMAAARRKALQLLDRLPQSRLAVMPFANIATLRCPFTGDHQALGGILEDCSPELFPAEMGLQGTAIGRAVQEALRYLGSARERGQAILVISDGADPDEKAVESAATAVKDAGIPVFGWYVADDSRKVSLMIDGKLEEMTSSRTTLERLAEVTGAVSVNCTTGPEDVEFLAKELEARLAARPWEERRRTVASERYRFPLLIAIGLIAAGALLPTRRRRPLLGKET